MNSQKYVKLADPLEEAVEKGIFPGAHAVVCSPQGIVWSWYGGLRQKEPVSLPLLANTAFDLASLTKIVCTTLCAARLHERGELDFDAPLSAFLDNPGNFSNSTVRQILTHTAGFIAEERLWDKVPNPADSLPHILHSPQLYKAGTKTVYSCFGFIVLGEILTAITKKRLDTLCSEEVTVPLGMNHTCFNPLKKNHYPDFPAKSDGNRFREGFAATEYDETGRNMLCGTVHDENARFLGGAAGNAGLFSTAADLAKPVCMLLREGLLPDAGRFLKQETITLFNKNATPGMDEARGIGFKLASYNAEQFAGTKMSRLSFGHTGFTGTSLLIDPERKIGVILLTNRVHPSRTENRLIDFRGRFHDIVAELADSEYT